MMVEWRPSVAAGPRSSGNLDSDGPQTAAAACAAEPGSGAESACMLEREQHRHLFLKSMNSANKRLCSPPTDTSIVS